METAPFADRPSGQFDAMDRSTSFLEADADVSGQSGHFSDPLDIGDDSPPLGYGFPPCMDMATMVCGEFHRTRI